MRFILEKENFLKILAPIANVCERKHHLPILAHVLISATASRIALTATDEEMVLTMQSTEGTIEEPGEITTNGRKLLEIIRNLPEGEAVKVDLRDGKLVIRAGRSRFSLSTLPVSDFPAAKGQAHVTTFSIDQSVFRDLMEYTHFSVAEEDVRYYLNGVFFSFDAKGVSAVSTDGHRLSLSQYHDLKTDTPQQIIIPRKTIMELMRLLGDAALPIHVRLGASSMEIEHPNFIFVSKLIEGRFPDYRKILNLVAPKTMVLNTQAVKQALQRVAILASEKHRGVRLCFTAGCLNIFSHDTDSDQAEESLPIAYEGENFEIAFNASYLLDVLNTFHPEKETLLQWVDEKTNIQLSEKKSEKTSIENIYVIMPLRL